MARLNRWATNLDNFDPRIVEGLAAARPLYALDCRGIGTSGGKAPLTIKQTSSDTITPAKHPPNISVKADR